MRASFNKEVQDDLGTTNMGGSIGCELMRHELEFALALFNDLDDVTKAGVFTLRHVEIFAVLDAVVTHRDGIDISTRNATPALDEC